MIRSMTGFGQASFELGGVSFEVEIRTVNHRHLDIRARLPRSLGGHEAALKAQVQQKLKRGKVDASVAVATGAISPPTLEIDRGVADQLVAAARELADVHGLAGDLRVAELLALPGVVRLVEREVDPEGFARAVAIALSKAPDAETLHLLSKRVPVPVERELHKSLFSRLGMDEAEAEQAELAPTTRAYINHLLSTATLGSVGDAAAALLPCPWSYHEIGQQVGEIEHPIYKPWASIYQQGFLAESVETWRWLVDEASQDAGEAQRRRMEQAFLTSSRYEYLFWEMAWRQERWPV